MRISKIILPLLILTVAACTSASDRVSEVSFGEAKALATTGNLRLVTERPRLQQDGTRQQVLCTEPSPDYAIAFSTKTSGNAKVTVANEGNGEGTLTVDQTEQATELQGRTAAVLALRDGLYAACQSYANGVIGHDAYAMILSQYGTLLVALVGESGTGKKGADDKPAAAPVLPQQPNPAKQATLATLLVACISEHDQTRGPGITMTNPVLGTPFCKDVVRHALRYGEKPG